MLKLLPAVLLACATTAVLAQETVSFTDDRGRTVEIPADPQRIVSLDDLRLTVPLLEMGVVPVGSHGRDGEPPYIRAAKLVAGQDFDTTDIAFLGSEISAEAVLTTEPDLIIVYGGRDEQLAQLEAIAPTVVLDPEVSDYMGIYETLADLANREGELARLQRRYDAQIAQLKSLVDPASISISVITAAEGQVTAPHTFGSLGIALRDAGFARPEFFDTLEPGTEAKLSGEQLALIDADLIIDSYRSDRGETPADAMARMEEVNAEYCAALWACDNGQYAILPREELYAISFQGLTASVYALTALVSARELTLQP
jgi:iron complex transport system substrate-binding protein